MKLQAHLPGYELLDLEIDSQGSILNYHLQCSTATLELFKKYQSQYGKVFSKWPDFLKDDVDLKSLPTPERRSRLLLQELLNKAQGRKPLPYAGEIVCDCRQVSSEVIDHSIIAKTSTVEEIAAWTTACTSCTNCKDKIEKIIQYRLSNQST